MADDASNIDQEPSFSEQQRKKYEKAKTLFREDNWKDFDPSKEKWIPFEEILAELDEIDRSDNPK